MGMEKTHSLQFLILVDHSKTRDIKTGLYLHSVMVSPESSGPHTCVCSRILRRADENTAY